MRQVLKFLLFFVVCLVLASCSSTRTVGQKLTEIDAPIKKIGVLANNKPYKSDFDRGTASISNKTTSKLLTVVQMRLPEVFLLNKIEASVYLTNPPLQPAELVQLNSFRYLLTINPSSTSHSNQGHTSVEMKASLVDQTDHKEVWRGAVRYSENLYTRINDEVGNNFAKELLVQLNHDGVIKLESDEPRMPAN